jgi:hypothetical protein
MQRLSGLTHLFLSAAGTLAFPGMASAIDWPQEITADEGTIVVYQPQPERLDGNRLSGRAAMSLELDDQEEAIFGAFWFDARIDTDTDADIATIRDVSITQVRWPGADDAAEQRFSAIVEAAVPETGFEISLERLSASLGDAANVQRSLDSLNTDPPQIVFSRELAVLLLYDGDPRFADIEDSGYERALNTPFAVARDKRSQRVYLSSGTFWYAANGPMGPFAPTESPPDDLARMVDAAVRAGAADADGAPAAAPAIVVATQPTELIVTDGNPDFQTLPGGDLLYVQNTETPWLRDLSTGNMYVLLSGRWYRSRSESGPWTFVRSDELPPSFARIPPDSDIGGVRVSVAGTDEADDAVLDAQIPQTAAIRRDESSLSIEYDGAPSFESIPGTEVAYAVNTGAQVLHIGAQYYAVDNGVWFVSGNATGPWSVADSIPEDQIRQIPPSSPVYNTTHVHIYDSTPDVVYVGYTPGYLWSYPYYGVPVYGTGYYYPPYRGRWYYPRPPTWGLHVGYNPWTGWNFGVSWSNGFFTAGVSWGGGWGGAYRPWGCCGGWYGGGYRPPIVINTGNINIGNSINVGNRMNLADRVGNGGNVDLGGARQNIYNRAENRSRVATGPAAAANRPRARPAPARANNVLADRDGNLSRVNGDRWQTLNGDRWQRDREIERARPTTRDRTAVSRMPSQLPRNRASELQRGWQSRQRATTRELGRVPVGAGARRMPAGGGGRLRR